MWTFHLQFMHQIGLAETIKLSKLLGNNSDIVIIGIAPKDYNLYRIEISPELKKVVPKIIDIICCHKKNLGKDFNPSSILICYLSFSLQGIE